MRIDTITGNLWFPKKGDPFNIEVPIGYIRSEIDPFIFEPIINICEYREEKKVRLRPCCLSTITYCKKDDQITNNRRCKECQDNSIKNSMKIID